MFQLTKLGDDAEIAQRIYLQWCELHEVVRIPKEKKDRLLIMIIEVMKKIESAKYHRDNLIRILEQEAKKREIAPFKSECIEADLSTGVEKELEAFLMQGKSTLDLLVKILDPLFGITLHTYGKSGDDVEKALKNNLTNDEKPRSEILWQLIKDNKNWIDRWFHSERTSVSHYRTLKSTGFVSIPDGKNASRQLSPSTPEGLPLKQIAKILYENLLSFCEEFIPLAASVKFPPSIILHVIPKENQRSYNPVKFGLVINIPKT